MCRETSTTSPSVSDWPLVPVPPPRGASFRSAKRGSCAARAIRTRSSMLSRERDRLGCELIDRVVRRQHGPVGIGLGQITGKAARPQLGQECRVQRRRTGYVDEAWDHDFTSLRNAGWAGSVPVRTTTWLSTQISARDRPGWRVENAYWAALFWCERWAGHKPHKRTKCQHGWPDRRELSTRKASNSIAMERIET